MVAISEPEHPSPSTTRFWSAGMISRRSNEVAAGDSHGQAHRGGPLSAQGHRRTRRLWTPEHRRARATQERGGDAGISHARARVQEHVAGTPTAVSFRSEREDVEGAQGA